MVAYNISLRRDLLAAAFNGDERLIRAFEEMGEAAEASQNTLETTVGATGALQDAYVLTLSPNDVFTNERIFTAGDGIALDNDGELLTVTVTGRAKALNYDINLIAEGETTLNVPLEAAHLIGDVNPSGVIPGSYASDAAASAGGVPVGGLYHNGGALRIRLT